MVRRLLTASGVGLLALGGIMFWATAYFVFLRRDLVWIAYVHYNDYPVLAYLHDALGEAYTFFTLFYLSLALAAVGAVLYFLAAGLRTSRS